MTSSHFSQRSSIPCITRLRPRPSRPARASGYDAHGVGTPTAKRPRVCLLHQVFRLLARRDETPRHPVHLVGELESLFFEANAVTGLRRQLARLGIASGLAHPATLASVRKRTVGPRRLFRSRAGE